MTVSSDAELLACFREIDRADVAPPDLPFPLAVAPLFAWNAGSRSFLLFCEHPTDRPRGIVFHRSTSAIPEVAAMCEWCHAVRSHGGVKLLTAAVGDRRRLGLYLCAGLGCLTTSELPGPDDLREHLDVEQRQENLVTRIASFASRRLF